LTSTSAVLPLRAIAFAAEDQVMSEHETATEEHEELQETGDGDESNAANDERIDEDGDPQY
jgi:hypothetical protein